jgi:hypothetical protein
VLREKGRGVERQRVSGKERERKEKRAGARREPWPHTKKNVF